MAYIMVDIEADGPIAGDYSMVCFGTIAVEPSLDRTFYGRWKPITWITQEWPSTTAQSNSVTKAKRTLVV